MEWTEQHDNILCQEILVLEPFKAKKGSIARGQIWDKIANNLNSLQHPQFRVRNDLSEDDIRFWAINLEQRCEMKKR